MINSAISALMDYGHCTQLVAPADKVYVTNQLLALLKLDSFTPVTVDTQRPLMDILKDILDYAVAQGIIEDGITSRDLFDTALMGCLTPAPSVVQGIYNAKRAESPVSATDWFYQFSQDTDYIRRDRIAKDRKWKSPSVYGDLDITINLSKPEKDPKAIAAAKSAPQGGYPQCMLCCENEGYAGRMNHPARQNLRLLPLTIDGQPWHLQYSPYVYYNEHCIALNAQHTPMAINRSTFRKLLDFTMQIPHYFVGSNADLPIVGGSILSHDHFQGGHYTFAMETAPVEKEVTFTDFEDVAAGIVNWPMSVLRLRCDDDKRLVDLADKILTAWRDYSDEACDILASSNGEPHNTITPIARRRGDDFELDLVLRNNRTTAQHPLGLFHPHAELHHIKKENIGLIEVMGLAVLPARLKDELASLADAIVNQKPLTDDLETHADWVATLQEKYGFTAENVTDILEREVGNVFAQVLEHAGVYKCDTAGRAGFVRFVEAVK
ncbi:UDP-glucose--hexose-1-phosphate uridylyltransferase [Bengtsoniella intestinalis]|uniref:UDP-glucose--hexose-1-phosphate uridylyltransferase n=1 Tax=Bengtsoniella intestinalis TaxID=3073143 RepID=UPI00391F6BB3